MLQRLVSKSRIAPGRMPEPTFSLIDSQSVKTTGAANNRGIDGGKKGKRAQAAYRY
jgi:putative transposase